MSQPQELVPFRGGFLWLTDTQISPAEMAQLQAQWREWFPASPLVVMPRTRVVEIAKDDDGREDDT